MNLENLKSLFIANGCTRVYVKELSANDNSKNQVYLAGDFEILNIFPILNIRSEEPGDGISERFKASLNFAWVTENGNLSIAPKSQLILYPAYPEVRFSGFLWKCQNPPSELMTQRLPGRLLFLSVARDGMVIGYVCHPTSAIASEFHNHPKDSVHGVFSIIELSGIADGRSTLVSELIRIHNLGWIDSKRLNSEGNTLPCISSNCGGYTLEAELGITPNGYSDPDYLGWEIKQFGVKSFSRLDSAVITLMTPEPTGGIYKHEGAEFFLHKYGYPDRMGRSDRINFGGVHKVGLTHHLTNLEMRLVGFDLDSGKIRNASGCISLIDWDGNEAASWSFADMLLHWNRKHNQACYIPSILDASESRKYKFGKIIKLGIGTDFQLFLQEMAAGRIYYDPGIKIENLSTKPSIKKRSQFRIKSGHLGNLYKHNEELEIC